MSGETEAQVSGWTTDTLRQHFTDLLNEKDARYEQRFQAQETALSTALTGQEKAVGAALLAQGTAVTKAERATMDKLTRFLKRRGGRKL